MSDNANDLFVENIDIAKAMANAGDISKAAMKIAVLNILNAELKYWLDSVKEGNWFNEQEKSCWFASIAETRRIIKMVEVL